MTNEMTNFESCSDTDDKSVNVKEEVTTFSSKNLSSGLKAAEFIAVDAKVKNELKSEEAEAFVTYPLVPPFSIATDDKREIKAEGVETFPGDLISPTENTSRFVSSSNFIDSSVVIKKEEDLGICFLEDERSAPFDCNSCAVSESREAHYGLNEASPSKRNQDADARSQNEAFSQVPTVSSLEAEASECEGSVGLQAAPQAPISDSFQCLECGLRYRTRRPLTDHLSRYHGKHFSCTHCPATFSSLKEQTLHETSHSNEKLFLCVRCNGTFKDQDTLTQHSKVHLKEGQFSCKYCQAVFSRILELYQHLHSHLPTHAVERNFSCGQCCATFQSKSYLKLHLIAHSRGQLPSCLYCAATFKNKGALASHMRVHADRLGKNRFSRRRCADT